MCSHVKHLSNLRNIFLKSVDSVRPGNLLSSSNNYCLEPRDEGGKLCIQVQGKFLDITNKNCHVVGFGKAVLGMAVQLEASLGETLKTGVLSIPKGSQKQFESESEMCLKSSTVLKVFEGAENNQPDEQALHAAKEIKKLAESLGESDILFVLISGGGSALLPLPKDSLKLKAKMLLIKELANRGASIQEMNVVRIALSAIKGGKLAAAASKAHAVISFVISDIVGDPVELIASGPTWPSNSKRHKPKDILSKFQMWQGTSDYIKQLLTKNDSEFSPASKNNSIYVVGDNRVATSAAVHESLSMEYIPFIASTTIQGEVSSLVTIYCEFLNSIYNFQDGTLDEHQLGQLFPFDSRIFQHFLKTLVMCQKTGKPLLLITAGEPTVEVTGSGIGGRNQELALRLSYEFYRQPHLRNVCFLSAGTDGIDGPCSAAGALGCSQVVFDFLSQNNLQQLQSFIENNDSFNFYRNLKDGKYHVITGHTGTNVMDLHLMLVL